ncbi:sorting nexin-24-like [Tubulanus polymorphus]|uniref:sorting nexin-24-like n=1 Tax=Tubulanus polymorphus TaxID=672921 RepID=UPI003DA6BBC0
MIRVSVPSSRRLEDSRSSYTVFRIQVYLSGRCHVIEKRYSEFEEVHKKLKKIIKTPEFPPKHVLKYHPKILEQRRQGFENYLQGIVDKGTVPKSLLMFLGIESMIYMTEDSTESLEDEYESEEEELSHQPVINISLHNIQNDNKGGFPDIVAQGVLSALYGTRRDV